MANRFRILGVISVIMGIVFLAAGGYAYLKVQSGSNALEGFSQAQDVTLSYNDQGQLVDRGQTAGADAILTLLEDDWHWPVVQGDLNPDNPVVNTATEYMYQMATIAHHTLDSTQTVVLPAVVYWDGSSVVDTAPAGATQYYGGEWDPSTVNEPAVFNPGTYTVPVDGRYWTGFNRMHPLDGPAREMAWTGTVHGLFAELGVGATTATSLELAFGVALVTALVGVGFIILGGGLLWIGFAKEPETQATA